MEYFHILLKELWIYLEEDLLYLIRDNCGKTYQDHFGEFYLV